VGFFVCKEDDGGQQRGGQVDRKRLTSIVVVFLDLGYDKAYYSISIVYWVGFFPL